MLFTYKLSSLTIQTRENEVFVTVISFVRFRSEFGRNPAEVLFAAAASSLPTSF
jgi:hypothetical protein